MNEMFLRQYALFQALKQNELGQDMVEYALVVALISLGITSAVTGVGAALVTAYTKIGTGIA